MTFFDDKMACYFFLSFEIVLVFLSKWVDLDFSLAIFLFYMTDNLGFWLNLWDYSTASLDEVKECLYILYAIDYVDNYDFKRRIADIVK